MVSKSPPVNAASNAAFRALGRLGFQMRGRLSARSLTFFGRMGALTDANSAISTPFSPWPRVRIDQGLMATILLVDDDASLRSLAQIILEEQGYRVLVADGGPRPLRPEAQDDARP